MRRRQQQYPIIKFVIEEGEHNPPLLVDRVNAGEGSEKMLSFELTETLILKHVAIDINGQSTETPVAFFMPAYRQEANDLLARLRKGIPK